MTSILKLLLAATAIGASLHGVNVFGLGMWPIVFSACGIVILASIFLPKLHTTAIAIAKLIGVLSLIAFILLMVAATIGGSFHLSESNQTIAFELALMAVFGCIFFLIKNKHTGT
jgi:hypothetical protein